MSMQLPLNLAHELSQLTGYWQPKIIDWHHYQFRLVTFQGEFGWHRHSTSKVLYIVSGDMWIDFSDTSDISAVQIKSGELYVVPADIEHQPFSENKCAILLIETVH